VLPRGIRRGFGVTRCCFQKPRQLLLKARQVDKHQLARKTSGKLKDTPEGSEVPISVFVPVTLQLQIDALIGCCARYCEGTKRKIGLFSSKSKKYPEQTENYRFARRRPPSHRYSRTTATDPALSRGKACCATVTRGPGIGNLLPPESSTRTTPADPADPFRPRLLSLRPPGHLCPSWRPSRAPPRSGPPSRPFAANAGLKSASGLPLPGMSRCTSRLCEVVGFTPRATRSRRRAHASGTIACPDASDPNRTGTRSSRSVLGSTPFRAIGYS
jgi:hypothetical protein